MLIRWDRSWATKDRWASAVFSASRPSSPAASSPPTRIANAPLDGDSTAGGTGRSQRVVGAASGARGAAAVVVLTPTSRIRSAARSRTEAARGLAATSSADAVSAPRVSSRSHGRSLLGDDRQAGRRRLASPPRPAPA